MEGGKAPRYHIQKPTDIHQPSSLGGVTFFQGANIVFYKMLIQNPDLGLCS